MFENPDLVVSGIFELYRIAMITVFCVTTVAYTAIICYKFIRRRMLEN